MLLHGNAARTPKQGLKLARRVAEEGCSLSEAAAAAEVSERTARKWVGRYREQGEAGLLDRSSAPASQPRATATAARDSAHAAPAGSTVHVCIDDATRLAYVEVLPDRQAISAIGFLKRAVRCCAARRQGRKV